MNRFQFIGNIGADATTRTLDNGSTAIAFSVAITEKYKGRDGQPVESTTWATCTYWRTGQQSTAIAQYLKKGQRVLVEGKPTARPFQTKDGTLAASLEVKVDNIELLGGTGQQQPAAPQAAPQKQWKESTPPTGPINTTIVGSGNAFDLNFDPNAPTDDLPF